jgi:HlyD family secretion protein
LQIFGASAFLSVMRPVCRSGDSVERRKFFSGLLPKAATTLSFGISVVLIAILSSGCSRPDPNVAQGYIEGEYVYIAAPLGGALTNLAVTRGSQVDTGQLLFELERGSESSALEAAKKNLDQAKAALALAESTYTRRKELRAGNAEVISAEELDRALAQRDADAAQVASFQAALEKAKWAFDQKQQSAPTNAFVHDTLYRPGEWVAPGSPVVVLLPPANLKARFFVPEEKLSQIKPGQTVSVSFDGASHAYSATVNYISSQAEFTPPVLYNRENRAKMIFMVEAAFSPDAAAQLRPGQPVDVRLQ